MKLIVIIILSLVQCISMSKCYSQDYQEDYYSPQNIYNFAENLYQTGDYLRAAGEFQRYIFISNLQSNDSVFFKIGLCYELADRPEAAIGYFNKVIKNYPNGNFFNAAHYQIAHTYFYFDETIKSIEYINDHIDNVSTNNGQYRMKLLTGANYFYKRQWDMANKCFSSLMINENQSANDSSVSLLYNYSVKGGQLPYKSKTAAGFLSAIIPGTGKMYAGRINDGLYSLAMVGLTFWQAYDGFHENGTHSIKGWFYGTISTIFYLGNIYGSVVTVKIHNRKLEDDLINQININLMWRQ